MGRRREQRTFVLIPVTVHGTDARGKPFEIAAETCDISEFGARLRGLSSIAVLGKRIEVDCRGQKAWYAIQWIGQPRTLSAKQVGIRLLEPGKYIWGVPSKPWAPDAFDTPELANGDRINDQLNAFESAGNEVERRRFPRMPFRVETLVTTEGSHAKMRGMITDISLGGCYVEMMGPVPIDTVVVLVLNSGDTPLHLFGTTRSSQPGFGMGVEFTKMSTLDFEKLQSLVPISPEAPTPASLPSQHSLVQSGNGASLVGKLFLAESNGDHSTTAEALEAVMRLLVRKGVLTRAEVAEEIVSVETASKVGSLP